MTQTVDSVMDAIRAMTREEQRQVLAEIEELLSSAAHRGMEEVLVKAGLAGGGSTRQWPVYLTVLPERGPSHKQE